MRAAALLIVTIAACDPLASEPRPCNDGPSLHVVVDLSDPSCAGVVPSYVDVSLPIVAQTYQDLMPPIIEYEYAWPSSLADGATMRITWWGTGPDSRSGFGALDVTAHPSTCEVAEIPVRCGIFVRDAQLD
ncbi:MAG TPA: hypothetical protein VL463_03065 [Kofleriaceae bacterium]|nr:hypothetical protein [Kofleriaceae bacterium]